MLTKEEIRTKTIELGFIDAGFTSADPFTTQKEILESRGEEYSWVINSGIDILSGTDPLIKLPDAKSILVIIEPYLQESMPARLEKHFGRCYLDDDRILRKRLTPRVVALIKYLTSNGIKLNLPGNLPDKKTAARAGLGTFGRNCLFFSRLEIYGSFVSPICMILDQEYEPDKPTTHRGCPDYCKNACVAACPTGALKVNELNYINPRKCVSYLSYTPTVITPIEYREGMGLYVYGCDRCQNVCPRNRPRLAKATQLPINKKVESMLEDFDLVKLLHMDKKYFSEKIWIHMFYTSPNDLWRWQMNAARVMGNTLEIKFIPELIRAFKENNDERVKGMCAWALGRLGGDESKASLEKFLKDNVGLVKEEVSAALNNFNS